MTGLKTIASISRTSLTAKHQAILQWNPDTFTFITQAVEIHENVEYYICKILEKRRYVDQVNKIRSGILNLA
jgi:hypothetical protein